MNAFLPYGIAFVFVFVISMVVIFAGRGFFALRRSGTVQIERRSAVLALPTDQVVRQLAAQGWVQSGAPSASGDINLSHGAINLVMSPTADGHTALSFLGCTCSSRDAASLGSKLDDAFAPVPAQPFGASASSAVFSGAWHPDPAGRWPLRYWDGVAWTAHVSGPNGTSFDPL